MNKLSIRDELWGMKGGRLVKQGSVNVGDVVVGE